MTQKIARTTTIARGGLALLLLACLQLSACTQWRYDLGSSLATVEHPEPEQQVSLQQALTLLGPPTLVTALDNGMMLAWEHWKIREDSIGISLGVLGAELLNLDWGKSRTTGEFLLLAFDMQHQLTSTTFSQWDDAAGGGVGIQPLASFLSVVDTGDLRDHMAQHAWGGSLLQPLPTGLNRESSLYTGQNGLEQRGTPRAVGQHSLELN